MDNWKSAVAEDPRETLPVRDQHKKEDVHECWPALIDGPVWDMYGIRMGYVWDMYGICMGYVWDMYGICMGYVWDTYRIACQARHVM